MRIVIRIMAAAFVVGFVAGWARRYYQNTPPPGWGSQAWAHYDNIEPIPFQRN